MGYAYASTYYARAAYDWTTELSIYVAKEARGQGIGSALYTALEEELQARRLLTLSGLYRSSERSEHFHA